MEQSVEQRQASIDSRSGFCNSNSVFYSKRQHLPLPPNPSLHVTSFISSLPHSGNIAFIDAVTGCHLTFPDFWRAVDSLSSSLSHLGLRKGHVVLLLSPNSIFFPVVCLSVMSLGAVITTANPLNTAQEIANQIAKCNPVLAFTTPQLVAKLPPVEVVLMGNDVPHAGVKVVGMLEEMIKKEPNQNPTRERVAQDDPATLLFSSGTTGESKAVVSTHRNIIAMIQIVAGRFRTHEKDQVYIAAIPMFHTFGLATFVLALLSRGCPVVVLPKFDMGVMLTAVEKYKVTYLPIAPPIIVHLANHADVIKKKYDLGSLRYILSGGAPLSKEVTGEFEEKYPKVTMLQGYALTESNGAGAAMESSEESERFGAAGLLTASSEARIVDAETGEALPVNRSGELWLRGPSIMKGYLNNEEATAETLVYDGWLRTGDLCYFDEDGFIFIVDRLKELIKYKGYQVPPAELEALLLTHPDIVDAAVIPFPDKKVGQYPMAFVVRKKGSSLSEAAVMEFISNQVAPFKRIRRVAFIATVPKNPSGKILRKNLIKHATSKV